MNRTAFCLALPLPLFCGLLFSCSESKEKSQSRQGSYVEVRAILDRSCMSCHGGGQSPRLVTYEEVRAVARSGQLLSSLDSTGAKSMPPGAPLPAEELAAIRLWIQGGMQADSQ